MSPVGVWHRQISAEAGLVAPTSSPTPKKTAINRAICLVVAASYFSLTCEKLVRYLRKRVFADGSRRLGE